MKFKNVQFWAATHYAPYLINADATGLDDVDEQRVVGYEKRLYRCYPNNGHFCIDTDNVDFKKCQISTTDAECVLYTYNYLVEA